MSHSGEKIKKILLVQLPVPQLAFGRHAGNIPLAGACLKQAVPGPIADGIEILPERWTTFLGDFALVELIAAARPDVVGFSVYAWNLKRSLYLAGEVKKSIGSRIVFGGPEMIPGMEIVWSGIVDFVVLGDGEAAWADLLVDDGLWAGRSLARPADGLFINAPSPYLEGIIGPDVENTMLLETQRGCPHRCGYCYYPKSKKKLAFKPQDSVMDALRWARDGQVAEVYFLDPSLTARPDLKALLRKIKREMGTEGPALISEIRAEFVNRELADLFAEAGFTWFEIGLQSINPRALEVMGRQGDLDRFLAGIRHLHRVGVHTRIDLILGLPGDDLAGFFKTVDFVADHGLEDDIMVFPLAVLPGTEFRRNQIRLGLDFDPEPPYLVRSTSAFSPEHLLMAFDYAEYRLGISFHPFPELDLAFRQGKQDPGFTDWEIELAGRRYFRKIVVSGPRPWRDWEFLASRLTHPYQVILPPGMKDHSLGRRVLALLSGANPFVPLEIVFFEPEEIPRPEEWLEAIHIDRPHFLDVEHRFMFSRPGNRAVVFTVVSSDPRVCFQGAMCRRVLWWRGPGLPLEKDLLECLDLDGVLIDSDAGVEAVACWQNQMALIQEDIPPVSFARRKNQAVWMNLTQGKDWDPRLA